MSADDNVKTIKRFYDAFGRGDVQTIPEGLTEDVDWAADTASTKAPWYGPHQGLLLPRDRGHGDPAHLYQRSLPFTVVVRGSEPQACS